MFRKKWMLTALMAIGCAEHPGAADATFPPAHDTAIARWSNFVERFGRYEPSDVPDLGTRTAGIDWPSFLGPKRDSKSPETGILSPWPSEGPPMVWQKRVGTSYDMPTVSRGRLFMFDRVGDRARLICMKSETGEELWQVHYRADYEDMYDYDTGPRCSPVVDDDRVYTFGAGGMLFCRRVLDGQPIWSIDTEEAFGVVQNFFGVGSTPLVEGNLLIVQVGGSPPDSPGVQSGRVDGNGSGVVAFDKFTGEIKYAITDELASYASPTAATIDGRRWAFVFARGGLIGFEPSTGAVDFHYPWQARLLESVNASNPVVVGNRVFISETYGPGSSLLEVRPGGYELIWRDDERRRDKSMKAHWNTVVHHDGYLYGCSGRNPLDGELRCIELATGRVMWRQGGLARSSLLYVDGHFICVAEYGELLLLKATPEKFEMISDLVLRGAAGERTPQGVAPPRLLNHPAWAAPIVSHGLLYVRGRQRLVCLELIPTRE